MPTQAQRRFSAVRTAKNARDRGPRAVVRPRSIPDRKEMARERRADLLSRIRGGVAVLFGAARSVRSGDVEFEYRQDNDFLYLTGFEEPDAVAVFAPDHPEHRYVLFVPPRDPEAERWDGPRAGVEGAVQMYGADAAYPVADLWKELPKYIDKAPRLHHFLGRRPELDERLLALVRELRAKRNRTGVAPTMLVDAAEVIHEMRLCKTAPEIEILRRAVAITVEGHLAAMREAGAGMRESEIHALLEYTFKRAGADACGYTPIVATGVHATFLHYRRGGGVLNDGDLLLIDAGAEHDAMTADVTRTYPVNGSFSREQRILYDLTLDAQRAAIGEVRPGKNFCDAHTAAVETLVDGFLNLGLVQGDRAKILEEKKEYRKLYMHRTGHWLGMDVHDVGVYGEGDARVLEPGMVLTVEPGIYVSPGTEGVDPRWWGIGIRIEDDVLVTPEGHEVLTADIPKDPEELCRIRRRARSTT